MDVTVVILGPQFKPWSSGPVISKTRIERLGCHRTMCETVGPTCK